MGQTFGLIPAATLVLLRITPSHLRPMSSNAGVDRLSVALEDARMALPAVIVGSVLLGVFSLLLIFSSYILKHKGLQKGAYAAMLAVVVLMYAIATTFWAVSVSSLIQTVGTPNDYALVDARVISRQGQILLVCECLNFWLSDIIVMWRTWRLWSYKPRARWVVGGVACILFIGVVVSGLFDLVVNHKRGVVAFAYPIFGLLGYYNIPSILYSTLVGKLSNIFSTALNAWCVVLAGIEAWEFRKLQKLAGRRLQDSRALMVLVLLTLCGALYCGLWIYWVAVSIGNSGPDLNVVLLLCNNAAAVQVNGIYPTFIIVCASLQEVNAADDPTMLSPFRAARARTSPPSRP